MSLVVVEDLHKTFMHMERALHVLRGITLTIDQGEMVSVVGSSGAGKSTLLHCIGTLDIPSKGRIQLAGEELTRLPGPRLAAIRNRLIGFVFQFHHLLPEFDALENVMMPGLIQGRSRREMEEKAHALLSEVGLGDRATHRPGELSGGEQQRVALARALVLGPKLILADEPTGNLDSATSSAMQKLFFEVNARHQTTIVVVTHDPGFAALMPRVVTLRDGRVEADERGQGGKPGVTLERAAELLSGARVSAASTDEASTDEASTDEASAEPEAERDTDEGKGDAKKAEAANEPQPPASEA